MLNSGKKTTRVEVGGSRQTASIPGSDALHTIREACATLGIGHTKCWDLIGKGELRVVRFGNRCTRVKRSSIDALIQNGASVDGGAE